jgi:hypothetical protein
MEATYYNYYNWTISPLLSLAGNFFIAHGPFVFALENLKRLVLAAMDVRRRAAARRTGWQAGKSSPNFSQSPSRAGCFAVVAVSARPSRFFIAVRLGPQHVLPKLTPQLI